METNRKIINNANDVKRIILKKNNIFYPISKSKFNKASHEYLKLLNNPISKRFIYTKVINKIQLKNSSNFSTKRQNHSDIKNKINKNKDFSKLKRINNNIKRYTEQNNNNKNLSIDKKRIFSKIYQEDKKNINLYTNETFLNNENKILYKNKKDNTIYKEMLKLWDDLIIPVSYRNIFNEILSQLEKEEKNKLILNEFNELDGLKRNITTLLDNIKMRKEIIYQLKQMNKNLKLIFKSEGKETNTTLVKNMSNNIEKLRNITINICLLMEKVKNKIYNGTIRGKYNIDLIAHYFHFDKNYLIKMKEELNSLKEGNAKFFFNISEDQSPFLMKASEEDIDTKKDPFIHIVPITEEIKEKIEKCNYIIYQELIAYQNRDFSNNIFRPISPQDEFNNFPSESTNNQNKNSKILNYSNLFLEQSRRGKEKKINKKELDIKFPLVKRNKNYQNSILKSNSCINFQINSLEFRNKTFFLTDLEKIKKNNFFDISNNDDNNFEKS